MTLNRVCGACTLCCKLLAVQELNKPTNKWCDHCIPGNGCKIYNGRPFSCKEFECGWLLSNLPIEYRPDHSHIIITGETAELDSVILHVDPRYSQAYESKIGKRIVNIIINNGKSVVLVTGEKRKIISTSVDSVKTVTDKIKELEDERNKKIN